MYISQFRVENFRSIHKTDWININSVTAFIGQNESGKSNLCEALYRLNPYRDEKYNLNEDWPVDNWPGKNKDALVCEARFVLNDEDEILNFLKNVGLFEEKPKTPATNEEGIAVGPIMTTPELPKLIQLKVSGYH